MTHVRTDIIASLENPPKDLSAELTRNACVALILKGTTWDDLEIAFIQRSTNPSDRWSGQIAFPGGKQEPSDASALEAAIRETYEEVGFTLTADDQVGRLDDIQGRKAGALLDFYIRPFVFHISRNVEVSLSEAEVADFFWLPVCELTNPDRQTVYTVLREQISLHLPAVNVDREIPLWGLTHLIVLNLLERLNLKKSQA